MKLSIALLLTTIVSAFLFCTTPSNPLSDPANGRIDAAKTLQFGTDSLSGSRTYACTVRVAFPSLLDSVSVYFDSGSSWQLLFSDTIGVQDSTFIFPLRPGKPGPFRLKAEVSRRDESAGRDSLVKNFVVFDFGPVVGAVQTRYAVVLGDSAALSYTIGDSDNDLLMFLLIPPTGTDTIVKLYSSGGGNPGSDIVQRVPCKTWGEQVWLAAAYDRKNNISGTVACTITVSDTSAPRLSYIEPTSAATVVISELPAQISILVQDEVPVDSVKFAHKTMERSGDTAHIEFSEFGDTLTKVYYVRAWNRAGLVDSIPISLRYKGIVKYPPSISKLSGQSILENQKFAIIKLDSIVTLHADAAYTADSLRWDVADEITTSGLKVKMDSIARTIEIYLAPADSEWSGSEGVKFKVTAPNGTQDFNSATFTVDSINDAPRFILTAQCKSPGAPFDTLLADNLAYDPDNKASTLSWTFDTTTGKIFTLVPVFYKYEFNPGGIKFPKRSAMIGWSRRWAVAQRTGVVLLDGWTGSDTLKLTVSDGKVSVPGKFVLRKSSTCGSREIRF